MNLIKIFPLYLNLCFCPMNIPQDINFGLDNPKESDMVDPNFYLEPRVEIDGHLYRIIMMQHHPHCPCRHGESTQYEQHE